jgi:tellurite resistance protein TerC
MGLLWFAFIALVLGLVLTDLFVLRPAPKPGEPVRDDTISKHLAFATGYLVLGMLFTFVVYLVYHHQLLGAGIKDGYTKELSGTSATLEYLSAFLLELVLSIDSVFVIAGVFAAFGIRRDYQHRLLFWGMLLALAMRAGFILLTGALLFEVRFTEGWIRFVLAGILFLAALRMMLVRKENLDPERNLVFKLIKRFIPMGRAQGTNLLTLSNGRAALTPLVVPIILIETADVFLAIDSVPASFAFSSEPLLIFAGSCFAMLVVRSLLPVLSLVVDRIRYFKLGSAAILIYSAVVIALPKSTILSAYQTSGWKLTPEQKLAFLSFAIVFGLVIAWFANPRSTRSDVSALGEDADRTLRNTLNIVRKVIVFTVGVTGIIGGAIMAIGPGPGIPLIFICALLLAAEFAWARRAVEKYRKPAEKATFAAAAQARKRGPWLLITIMLVSIAFAVLIDIYTAVPTGLVIAGLIPMLAGQAFMGYLAFFYKAPTDQSGSPPPLPPSQSQTQSPSERA